MQYFLLSTKNYRGISYDETVSKTRTCVTPAMTRTCVTIHVRNHVTLQFELHVTRRTLKRFLLIMIHPMSQQFLNFVRRVNAHVAQIRRTIKVFRAHMRVQFPIPLACKVAHTARERCSGVMRSAQMSCHHCPGATPVRTFRALHVFSFHRFLLFFF